MYDITTSSLQIETEINLESKSIELKGNSKGEKVTDQYNQIKTWTLNKNKAIAKLDDEEIKKKLENVQEGLIGFGSFVGDSALIKNMKEAADFIDPDKGGLGKKLIEGGKALGSVNSTVGFVFDVLDVFMGKPAGSSTPQTVKLYPFSTTGTASSTGSITTQGYRDERVFDIPGTFHSTFNTNTPYWDCPLGVFGLMESPKIVYRNCKSETGYVSPGVGNCQGGYVEDIQNMKDYKSYKIVDNLKIALNPASEMDILSCEAAFIGKVKERIFNGDTIPAYNIYLNPYRYDWECDDYYDNTSYTNNFIYTCLRNGQYVMSEKDPSGFHEFRTPYINIENFKNTSFTVHKDIKIFIRLKLILQKKGSPDSPLMPVSISYDLTNFELDNSSKEIFPFIRAQLSEVNVIATPLYYRKMSSNSSYYTSDLVYRGNEFKKISSSTITSGSYSDGVLETNGNVNVNAVNGNVLFNANYSISLKPGFTATSGNGKYFKASIINNSNIIDNSFIPLSNLIFDNFTYPNCNCGGSLKSSKISKEKNNISDEYNMPNGINAYPNPTNDYIGVELHGFEECTIQVFNMQGLVLYESKQNSASFEIDLTKYPNGIYFILAKTNDSSYSTKILKQ